MKDKKEIPDTTYLALLGEKKFRWFHKIREYAIRKMQMELWYVDSKSRRGKYYLYYHKILAKDKEMITDSLVLTFAVNEYLLNCEILVTKDVWKKIVENKKIFSDAAQRSIEYNGDEEAKYDVEAKEWWFSTFVSDQQSFEDVMRVLAWVELRFNAS